MKKSRGFVVIPIAGCKAAAAVRGAHGKGLSQHVAAPGWGWREDSWMREARDR